MKTVIETCVLLGVLLMAGDDPAHTRPVDDATSKIEQVDVPAAAGFSVSRNGGVPGEPELQERPQPRDVLMFNSLPQEPEISIWPRSGPSGTDVTVGWTGLSPETIVVVGFGGLGSGYEWVGRARTDADGAFSTEAVVPAWAEAYTAYYFFVAYPDQPPSGVSKAFHVTGPDGVVRLQGTVTDDGVACTALRDDNDELYTLVGDVEGLSPGDRVVVEGTVAEGSICQQGLTIEVARVVG